MHKETKVARRDGAALGALPSVVLPAGQILAADLALEAQHDGLSRRARIDRGIEHRRLPRVAARGVTGVATRITPGVADGLHSTAVRRLVVGRFGCSPQAPSPKRHAGDKSQHHRCFVHEGPAGARPGVPIKVVEV